MNNSPSTFLLAARSGHYDLAETVIYITAAQRGNAKEATDQLQGIDLYAKLVDETFSVNSIKAVHKLAQSSAHQSRLLRTPKFSQLVTEPTTKL